MEFPTFNLDTIMSATSDFIQGYVECALWSSSDDSGEPFDANYGTADLILSADALAECADFIDANRADLEAYCEALGPFEGTPAWARAGHDFWLTRNRHGAGFWDRGLGARHPPSITRAALAYGERGVIEGDDGRLYLA